MVSINGKRVGFIDRAHTLINKTPNRGVAYFCMEYGIEKKLPIYGGGLGVLAGDTIKSAADTGLPFVGVGLLYRQGYFRQEIDAEGRQIAHPESWNPAEHPGLIDLENGVTVNIEGADVRFRLWGYEVQGHGGGYAPLILLDSAGFPNHPVLADITTQLYMPDPHARVWQEMALGIGGMRALRELGLQVRYFHLNEGHAAFAPLEFLNFLGSSDADALKAVRERFSFTTHTPVPAGFDRFDLAMLQTAFRESALREGALRFGLDPDNPGYVSMAVLAMRLSGACNAVAQLHAVVSRKMFPGHDIFPVTNGVHHLTWTAEGFAKLYDRFCPGWREDPSRLRLLEECAEDPEFRALFWAAHQEAKAKLIALAREKSGVDLDPNAFTVGFARRFATYKQGDLVLSDPQELIRIAEELGPIQIIFAGKAHPKDVLGQQIITDVIQKGKKITKASGGKVKVIFLEGYDLDLGAVLTAGSDIWLNTPLPPNEASGTSGQKAALNGKPHVSTPDGWWPEGSRRDTTGWTFGDGVEWTRENLAKALFPVLRTVTSTWYTNREAFLDKMIAAVRLNGSYFNTQRMIGTYVERVWSDTRAVSLAGFQKEETPPRMPPHTKLKNLGRIARALHLAGNLREIENQTAVALLQNLARSVRVTRYDVHATNSNIESASVKIGRRWREGRLGEVVFEEMPADMGTSGFAFWRMFKDFQDEVMADLLREQKAQIVRAPDLDPRCLREGMLVSPVPFILIPEIVNGQTLGVFKIDFHKEAELGGAFEPEFVGELMTLTSQVKADALRTALAEDLRKFSSAQALTNWALTLMTGGGFVDMPRYAARSNRAAFFTASEGNFIGELAVGEVGWQEHGVALGELAEMVYAQGVERALRSRDQRRSSLSSHIRGRSIGAPVLPSPVLIEYGFPTSFDPAKFTGRFNAQSFAALKANVEKLFAMNGNTIARYLLLPVFGERGTPSGLFYIDNAFAPEEPINPDTFNAIAAVFGQSLARIQGFDQPAI